MPEGPAPGSRRPPPAGHEEGVSPHSGRIQFSVGDAPKHRKEERPNLIGDPQYAWRLIRTVFAIVIAGGLWSVLAVELIGRWCLLSCSVADSGLIAAWPAAAAMAAGRVAWSWDAPRQAAAVAFLVVSAFYVTWPIYAAEFLAGDLMVALLAAAPGGGYVLHWSLIALIHIAGLLLIELVTKAIQDRFMYPDPAD